MMQCPKCGYERTPSDTAPEWQCPACGIAYAKFGTVAHGQANNLAAENPPSSARMPPPAAFPSAIGAPMPAPVPDEAGVEEAADAAATPAQVKRARVIETAITAGAFVLAYFGSAFMQWRTYVYVLLALPWLAMALVAMFGQWFTYRVRDRHHGAMARSSVAGVLLAAALALLFLSHRHYVPRETLQLWGYGLFGAACMTGFAVATSPGLRWRWPLIAGIYLKTGMYCAGAAMSVNAVLDHAPAPSDLAEIETKYTRPGSKGATYYYLYAHYLDNPRHTAEIRSSYRWYTKKKAGDIVCLYHHPGYLGLGWDRFSDCTPARLAQQIERLVALGVERVAATLELNQIHDEAFRQRVNDRLRADLRKLRGDESVRDIQRLADASLEKEGFVFVD